MVFRSALVTIIAIFIIALSHVLTRYWEKLAIRYRIHDVPNDRTSHESVTPRAGGIVILAIMFVSASLLLFTFSTYGHIGLTLLLSVTTAGIIGFADDVFSLSAKTRILLYGSLVILFLLFFPEELVIHFFSLSMMPKFLQYLFMFIFLLWVLNLYNFMDGINGIAGGQLVSIGIPLFIMVFMAKDYFLSIALLVMIVPTFGFLTRNWKKRADVFLGDVGSVMIGFFIGTIGLIGETHSSLSLSTWLIMMGVFIVDSTLTLIRRIIDKKNPFKPHKSHAYQHAQQKYGSHLKVSSYIVLINLFWLFPISVVNFYTRIIPEWVMLIVAWFPLVILAFIFKAGKEFFILDK